MLAELGSLLARVSLAEWSVPGERALFQALRHGDSWWTPQALEW